MTQRLDALQAALEAALGARITLKHAEIKLYDMPGMTGAYKVQDPSMLDKVQVGDRVQFSLDRVNSVYTITRIDVQK